MTVETAAKESPIAPLIPRHRTRQVLVSSADMAGKTYLAFPSLIRTSHKEVLISFKRGFRHGGDGEADLDLVRFDTQANLVLEHRTLGHIDRIVLQMGEWVRYPNGDIANYVDAQLTGVKKVSYRTGICGWRSTDGGKTFGPLEEFGVVHGVEYGYPFQSLCIDRSVYLLVMTFEYLQGRKGSVDVIRSDDNGTSWRLVRDLSHEFGDVPINETTFVRHGDGFLVSTRGYDERQRLHRTDSDFAVLDQVDLTERYPFIQRHVGRPRLFEKDGRYYLMGRNFTGLTAKEYMKECLFRIDPDTLEIVSWAILDNHEEGRVIDGYYPVCYWQERDGREWFNVIDYKSTAGCCPGPDILRFEFDWDEVR